MSSAPADTVLRLNNSVIICLALILAIVAAIIGTPSRGAFLGMCVATLVATVANRSDRRKPALLMTPKQAAEALAISARKLWGMTASGEIPHLRIGRSVRYPVDALQAWIDAQQRGGER